MLSIHSKSPLAFPPLLFPFYKTLPLLNAVLLLLFLLSLMFVLQHAFYSLQATNSYLSLHFLNLPNVKLSRQLFPSQNAHNFSHIGSFLHTPLSLISAKKFPAKRSPPQEGKHNAHHGHRNKKAFGPIIAASFFNLAIARRKNHDDNILPPIFLPSTEPPLAI